MGNCHIYQHSKPTLVLLCEAAQVCTAFRNQTMAACSARLESLIQTEEMDYI